MLSLVPLDLLSSAAFRIAWLNFLTFLWVFLALQLIPNAYRSVNNCKFTPLFSFTLPHGKVLFFSLDKRCVIIIVFFLKAQLFFTLNLFSKELFKCIKKEIADTHLLRLCEEYSILTGVASTQLPGKPNEHKNI